VDLAYQNLESVELGVTTVDHYFDTLGGIARATRRVQGRAGNAGLHRRPDPRRRHRAHAQGPDRAGNPRPQPEPQVLRGPAAHGAEGVRQIEAHVTNTLGWSATTGVVEPWVYQRLSETFVLDDAMRARLASLNSAASSRLAQRLLEASDRNYWHPDADTLAALQQAADDLEDRMEGIAAE
jgi:magnesium chelatase subunit H